VQFAQELAAGGIQYLLDHTDLEHIQVICKMGNHGRSTEKKRISTDYRSSWEWVVYHGLAKAYQHEPRLSFDIGKGYHTLISIWGYKVRIHHGDGIRYNGGVGGITIPVNKAIAQWNKSGYVNFDIFGHYHTYMATMNWMSVGCLCGYNGYALSIKADYQPPTQGFVLWSKSHGLTAALPVYCGGKKASENEHAENYRSA
jgi:hypothetical protein